MADIVNLSHASIEQGIGISSDVSPSDVIPRSALLQVRNAAYGCPGSVSEFSRQEGSTEISSPAEGSLCNVSFLNQIPAPLWEQSDELFDLIGRKMELFHERSGQLAMQVLELGSKWVFSKMTVAIKSSNDSPAVKQIRR